jgi:oligoribonuclease
MPNTGRLVWIDLEMTGLDPERDCIVEIASLITDDELETIAEGPDLVIHQPEPVLAAMSAEVRALHQRSGLLDAIQRSTTGLEEAAARTFELVQRHCAAGQALLAGNSVWKDRAFLGRYMPELDRYLHYRIIDVSTVKELARRWYGAEGRCPAKAEQHRAADDIRESIAELRWYRAKLFVPVPPSPASPADPPTR